MGTFLKLVGSFLKNAFSESGTPSSSRLLSLLHSVVSCVCLLFIAFYTKKLPDATVVMALATFSSAPYTVGQIKNMISAGKSSAQDPSVTPPAPAQYAAPLP